eukprot:3629774-Rhodomonas_salina.1
MLRPTQLVWPEQSPSINFTRLATSNSNMLGKNWLRLSGSSHTCRATSLKGPITITMTTSVSPNWTMDSGFLRRLNIRCFLKDYLLRNWRNQARRFKESRHGQRDLFCRAREPRPWRNV